MIQWFLKLLHGVRSFKKPPPAKKRIEVIQVDETDLVPEEPCPNRIFDAEFWLEQVLDCMCDCGITHVAIRKRTQFPEIEAVASKSDKKRRKQPPGPIVSSLDDQAKKKLTELLWRMSRAETDGLPPREKDVVLWKLAYKPIGRVKRLYASFSKKGTPWGIRIYAVYDEEIASPGSSLTLPPPPPSRGGST